MCWRRPAGRGGIRRGECCTLAMLTASPDEDAVMEESRLVSAAAAPSGDMVSASCRVRAARRGLIRAHSAANYPSQLSSKKRRNFPATSAGRVTSPSTTDRTAGP
jgi:hypothetical protein